VTLLILCVQSKLQCETLIGVCTVQNETVIFVCTAQIETVIDVCTLCEAETDCITDTAATQPQPNSNTHRTKSNKTNMIIQQIRRKLLMMYT